MRTVSSCVCAKTLPRYTHGTSNRSRTHFSLYIFAILYFLLFYCFVLFVVLFDILYQSVTWLYAYDSVYFFVLFLILLIFFLHSNQILSLANAYWRKALRMWRVLQTLHSEEFIEHPQNHTYRSVLHKNFYFNFKKKKFSLENDAFFHWP